MSGDSSRVPAGSQTVGPYFRIGLDYLIDRTPTLPLDTRTIEIRGRVLDRDGAPVPDAMLEFWSATPTSDRFSGEEVSPGFPAGFRRAPTDMEGRFSIVIERPVPVPLNGERTQAPHILVLVYARGLLRHLIARVYLGDQQANDNDPVLMLVPEERRSTLIAQPDESRAGLYRWDVVLQGTCETVFFAW